MVDNFSITILNEVKDLFIFDAYFNLSPQASVILCFSEPAKSTKCILEDLMEKEPEFDAFSFIYIFKVKIECDLED